MSEILDLPTISPTVSAESSSTEASEAPTRTDTHTRARQDSFLEAYAACGNVAGAAFLAEIHRSTHYDWMRDEAYKSRFELADAEFIDSIRNELRVRGVDGWMEPVVYKGRIQFVEELDDKGEIKLDPATGRPIARVVAIRRKSDRILELLARAKVPECKDKLEVTQRKQLEEIIGGSNG